MFDRLQQDSQQPHEKDRADGNLALPRHLETRDGKNGHGEDDNVQDDAGDGFAPDELDEDVASAAEDFVSVGPVKGMALFHGGYLGACAVVVHVSRRRFA